MAVSCMTLFASGAAELRASDGQRLLMSACGTVCDCGERRFKTRFATSDVKPLVRMLVDFRNRHSHAEPYLLEEDGDGWLPLACWPASVSTAPANTVERIGSVAVCVRALGQPGVTLTLHAHDQVFTATRGRIMHELLTTQCPTAWAPALALAREALGLCGPAAPPETSEPVCVALPRPSDCASCPTPACHTDLAGLCEHAPVAVQWRADVQATFWVDGDRVLALGWHDSSLLVSLPPRADGSHSRLFRHWTPLGGTVVRSADEPSVGCKGSGPSADHAAVMAAALSLLVPRSLPLRCDPSPAGTFTLWPDGRIHAEFLDGTQAWMDGAQRECCVVLPDGTRSECRLDAGTQHAGGCEAYLAAMLEYAVWVLTAEPPPLHDP